MEKKVNPALKAYIEEEIIPRYDAFDKGHRRDHVNYVIGQALYLASFYDVDIDMVYTAAAYHDTGLCEDRKTHHTVSASIVRADSRLLSFFTPDQIETIAQAAEDHRASLDHDPRTIYGRIIAEADRQIVPETVIRRTIQYGLSHYPELDHEGHWSRTVEHLHEKYAEGGYLKLWIPESPNAGRMRELRAIIRDEAGLRALFERLFAEETTPEGKVDAGCDPEGKADAGCAPAGKAAGGCDPAGKSAGGQVSSSAAENISEAGPKPIE